MEDCHCQNPELKFLSLCLLVCYFLHSGSPKGLVVVGISSPGC
jgi:hypothetical protein